MGLTKTLKSVSFWKEAESYTEIASDRCIGKCICPVPVEKHQSEPHMSVH